MRFPLKSFIPFSLILSISLCGSPAPSRADVLSEAQTRNLWNSPGWLTLGHYKRGLWGLRSQVDEKSFFLASNGKGNPRAELEATIELFSNPPQDPAKDFRCQFPARYQWLKKELGPAGEALQMPTCSALDDWLGRLNSHSVSMIFASAYLNSPASMYGHTFLRLDPKTEGQETLSLLSYSINFAAEANTKNGLVFAYKGLMGGYPGKFATVPYYMKIQQYNNLESRDLWEYRLNLSPEEIRTMLLHLWELGGVYFDYYFLTENCSYQLLPLLEAARPDLKLSSRFHFKAIPMDTVRVMRDVPGLLGPGLLRPSAVRKLMEARSRLSREELEIVEAIGADPEGTLPRRLDEAAPDRKGAVISTAYQYFRFRHHYSRYQDDKTDAEERKLLLAMSGAEIPVDPEIRPGPENESPELAHGSGRAAFLAGVRNGDAVGEIDLRGALHDLLDPLRGYVPDSRLEMFRLVTRYSSSNEKVFVRRFGFVDILSLYPLDRWSKKPSWGFFMGLDSRSDRLDQSWDTLYARLKPSGGVSATLDVAGRKTVFYLLGETDVGAAPGIVFQKGYRVGAGGIGGIAVELLPSLKIWSECDYKNYFFGEEASLFRFRTEAAVTLRESLQLRASYEKNDAIDEFLSGVYLLF